MVSEPMIEHVSVVILTLNEEATIGNTLDHLKIFSDIVVVDSNSSDSTAEIARRHGARICAFSWNEQYPKKKQWALENSDTRNAWVLLLDADEYPSPELIEEIRAIAPDLRDNRFSAYDLTLTYRFAGKLLQHGHRVAKRSLLNTNEASFPVVDDLNAPGIREVEGHYQPVTSGHIGRLKGRLVHDDRDPVSSWFSRHNKYSDWEAHLRLHAGARKDIASKRTRKGRLFDAVPLKPVLFFLYSYLARAGFLDGRAGFDYAVALATYYWQIGVKYRELQREAPAAAQPS